eukprot:UN02453
MADYLIFASKAAGDTEVEQYEESQIYTEVLHHIHELNSTENYNVDNMNKSIDRVSIIIEYKLFFIRWIKRRYRQYREFLMIAMLAACIGTLSG